MGKLVKMKNDEETIAKIHSHEFLVFRERNKKPGTKQNVQIFSYKNFKVCDREREKYMEYLSTLYASIQHISIIHCDIIIYEMNVLKGRKCMLKRKKMRNNEREEEE